MKAWRFTSQQRPRSRRPVGAAVPSTLREPIISNIDMGANQPSVVRRNSHAWGRLPMLAIGRHPEPLRIVRGPGAPRSFSFVDLRNDQTLAASISARAPSFPNLVVRRPSVAVPLNNESGPRLLIALAPAMSCLFFCHFSGPETKHPLRRLHHSHAKAFSL